MRVLLVFIDGLGLGGETESNPLSFAKTPGFNSLLGGRNLTFKSAGFTGSLATLLALDATLGVPGLPQSATGQATIFTGENAPLYLGRHLNGLPEAKLRRLIAKRSMFKILKKQGYKVSFANAYRPVFFNKLARGLPGHRYSCSTLTTYYGRVKFRSLADLKRGQALYMDISGEVLGQMGYPVAPLTPEEGAVQLHKISAQYDFSLFEYFLSDRAGHLADREESVRIVDILDRFIGRLAGLINPAEEFIIVTSDHGNMEDLTTLKHTCNKVPALLIGEGALREELKNSMHDLTDVLPAIKTVLSSRGR